MACISKLANAIAYDCDSGATGLVSAIIINKSDIAGFTIGGSGTVSGITLASGAKAYKIDTVKRSLVVSSALKVNEGAPNAYSHSASITSMQHSSARQFTEIGNAFANGSFVIIARHVGGSAANAYGLYYGLSATANDFNSHDNGSWSAITLETPENVIGEDNITVDAGVYNDLFAAAIG